MMMRHDGGGGEGWGLQQAPDHKVLGGSRDLPPRLPHQIQRFPQHPSKDFPVCAPPEWRHALPAPRRLPGEARTPHTPCTVPLHSDGMIFCSCVGITW